MISKIIKLWNYLSKRRQIQFFLLVIVMIVASFAEILSLGAVIPFLGAITNPDLVFQNDFLQPLFVFFNITVLF